MRKKFSEVVQYLCTLSIFLGINSISAAPSYETYLQSWDSQWKNAMENLPSIPSNTAAYNNTTLDIAFAAYLFEAGINPEVQGTQFQDPNKDIGTIIKFVQSNGGKVKLSYGGASYAPPAYPNYFISQTTAAGGWPNNISYLADGVIKAIKTNYGTLQEPLYLDGVDFDIEDPQPTTINGQPYSAKDFADDLYNFLTLVREGLQDKTISITIPGQGWGTYWEQIAKLASSKNKITLADAPVDSVNFMEYDIYVTPGYTYAQQITGDLVTYTSLPSNAPSPNWTPGWGINPEKIQLGLMPGNDDIKNILSVDDAKDLASIASTENKFGAPLYGVMTWSLDRDALTDTNPNTASNPTTLTPPPYQYSNAIRSILNRPKPYFKLIRTNYKKRKVAIYPSLFERQAPPPHGYLAS